MKRKLFVFVPGFGSPHVEEKTRILLNNIKKIKDNQGLWGEVFFEIAVYDDTIVPDEILQEDVNILYTRGIVGNFLTRFVTPERLQTGGYDDVLLLLDDVELMDNVDWRHVLVCKKMGGADIVSPTLTVDSEIVYSYMRHTPNADYTGRVSLIGEFFCFLMEAATYCDSYFPLLDDTNPWMWGVDLILFAEAGLLTLLVNTWTVKHHYRGESYKMCDNNPETDMLDYLKKRKYKEIGKLAQQQHLTTVTIERRNVHVERKLFDKYYPSKS
jgi:hypothetical protein